MKRKFRTTLFLIVLFVLTATSLLGQSRVFDPSHIDVWLEDYLAGSPTTAIIGTKVQVTLTDPDLGTSSQIETVYANFSQFGAYPEEIQMVWDADISKWKATYQVAPGTLSGTQARVKIHSISQNENEQSIWDDAYFTVNNVPTILTGLEINTHTLAELQAEDPELTTFDALTQMSSLPLLIELKASASANHVIEYMHQHPESYATSFLEPELSAIKAAGIDPARLFLAQHNHPIGLVARASNNKFGGISVNKWYALPWLYHKATKRHLKVMFYTVNSKLLARWIRSITRTPSFALMILAQ